MKNNIIFIGFMGCGKSTIAKALAKIINYEFLDSDTIIEKECKLSIKEIFDQKGEDFFRQKEKELAFSLMDKNNIVLATGGGFYKVLNKHPNHFIIYIKNSFENIISRLNEKQIQKRPLLKDLKKAKKIYDSRIKDYEALADTIINIKNKNLDQIIENILKELR